MRLDHPPRFALHERRGHRLVLRAPGGATAEVRVLEHDIVRLTVLPHGNLRFPRTWAIAPGLDDVPIEGRDRQDVTGFMLPAFDMDEQPGQLCITTGQIRLTIALDGFACRWETRRGEAWLAAAEDRPTQGYNFGWWDARVYHYLKRERDEQYFGLGERAGDTNRAGQRYRMCNLDPMGYNARSTDPLYKHIPFYITRKPRSGVTFGLFYDTLADCSFDMGREMDNYHGPYRSFVADHGDLDLYFIAGETAAAVTRRYTWLTGRPIFTPRYALGYSGSTMTYTDAPDAQVRMQEFIDRCREHDIPCESFHLSSGYTSIGDKRYVFNWNRDKFPDPAAFAASYREAGVRLVANIKPALLRDHPRFDEAAAVGLLVRDPDGQPTAVQFWDDTGAYLDFTNPATIQWWKARVTDSLLAYGIAATWNDNNEFEIWSDQARVHGFGDERAAIEARPLHTLLMIQASHAAQLAFAPNERPLLISRSGAAGMQRYVQTWSGDNCTAWETLRYNIKMGLGLAMSGVSNTGHDIGGFSGPAPDPELFVRWVQHGIFLPRFSIHSWNDDKSVNEPWMYPEHTAQIRDLIKLRCRLTPYLYDLVWRSHSFYEPIIRPTFYDFPDDERCYDENDDSMLGASLLVPSVVEPGQTERRVRLPKGADWFDFWTGERHAGDRWITLAAPLDGPPPLLARAGSAVPLNVAEARFGSRSDRRGFQVFPLEQGRFEVSCFEDDGASQAWRDGQCLHWRLGIDCSSNSIAIAIDRDAREPGSEVDLVLLLPDSERRAVILDGATVVSDAPADAGRQVVARVGPSLIDTDIISP